MPACRIPLHEQHENGWAYLHEMNASCGHISMRDACNTCHDDWMTNQLSTIQVSISNLKRSTTTVRCACALCPSRLGPPARPLCVFGLAYALRAFALLGAWDAPRAYGVPCIVALLYLGGGIGACSAQASVQNNNPYL